MKPEKKQFNLMSVTQCLLLFQNNRFFSCPDTVGIFRRLSDGEERFQVLSLVNCHWLLVFYGFGESIWHLRVIAKSLNC